MDPRDRADAALSRARARGAYVVTPENAISPMDASNTQQIPRSVVDEADLRAIDPDATTVVRDEEIRRQDGPGYLADREPTSQLGATPEVPIPVVQKETPPEASAPESEMETEELDAFIPTTTQRARSSLSRRLDG